MSGHRAGLVVVVAVAIAAAVFLRHRPAAEPGPVSGSAIATQGATEVANAGSSQRPAPSADEVPAVTGLRDPPAAADAAAAPSAPAVDARPSDTATAIPIPSANAARALMLERQRDNDCQLARSTHANFNQRRGELVERIRSGQVAGMFDPPPTPPGGG